MAGPFDDLPPWLRDTLRNRRPRLADVERLLQERGQSRIPNEGTFGRSQRRGQVLAELEQRWMGAYQKPEGTTQMPNESNWGYGLRTTGHNIGQGLANLGPEIVTRVNREVGHLADRGREAVQLVTEPFAYARDTPAQRDNRAAQRQQRDNLANGILQAGSFAGNAIGRVAAASPTAQGPAAGPRRGGQLPGDVVQFFINKGRPEHVARAIAAGIMSESSGDHSAFNPAGGGEGAFGLGQWRGPRLRALRQRYGANPTRAQQLEFLNWELERGDPGGRSVLTARTAEEATANYIGNFMRPGRHTQSGTARAMRYLNGTSGTPTGIMEQAQGYAEGWGTPPPDFNPAPFNAAIRSTQQAGQMLMRPYSTTNPESARPELQAPTPFQAPDFTAGNAAFEAARPKNPFDDPVDRERVQRRHYFQGLAQGLASMNWSSGPGLGELFARVGAGAMGGRIRGDEYIEERERVYEEQLRQYNAALASRNDQQAGQIAQVANQNIAQMNDHNNRKHSELLQEWARDLPVVSNGMVVTRRRDPNDPQRVTTTHTPIGNAVAAETLMRVGQLQMQRGVAESQHGIMTWQAQQETARTALGLVLQNQEATPDQRDQAATIELASRVGALVDSGRWGETVDDNTRQQILGQAYAAAGFQPQPTSPQPTSEQARVIRDYIAARLLEGTIRGGQAAIQQLYENPAAQSAYMMGLSGDRSVSTRTDSRGRTSTTTRQNY